MMHRCSSSSHMMGQCTCGMYHGHGHSQTNSFTMLFQSDHHMYPFSSSPSSSSVDCTLSLGTPSTRLCEEEIRHETHHRPSSSSSSSSSFCWDILQTHKNSAHYSSSQTHKTSRGTSNTNTNNGDPLLARRCANCDTTSTPLWRNGPRGPKSLCNACGIRFKKEERRATATAANGINGNGSSGGSTTMEQQQQQYYGYNNNNQSNTWAAQKMQCYSPGAAAANRNSELRFIEETEYHHNIHRDSDSSSSAIPFLSWRLNVTDRPSLVHDFTR